MTDISATGLTINVIASFSFPQGFEVTDFSDDTDPFDVPALALGDGAMGLNGNFLSWSVANPLSISLAVVPYSDSDLNLSALLELNRVGDGKSSVGDVITMTARYPNRTIPLILTNGKMVSGTPLSSAASSGRIKTKTYAFLFGNKVGF